MSRLIAAIVAIAIAIGGAVSGEEPRGLASFRLPEGPTARDRTAKGVDWLKRHLVTVAHPNVDRPIPVIAWHDPTLDPGDPTRLVGYLITDTLWSARALQPFDPAVSAEMDRGLRALRWTGNGLQDVLFHPVERMLHRSDDEDPVHGHSLGRHPIEGGGGSVELRVMRQRWDPDFEKGHPALFAEHAAYQALHDYWAGRGDDARRRILGIVRDDRATEPGDSIFWDDEAGILVDRVQLDDWLRFREGRAETCRHPSFKLGVLLYAVRLMGLDEEVGAPLEHMKRRLWSAQHEDGGVAHFVDVGREQGAPPRRLAPGATGESTAIAILSETVQPGE